MNVFHNFSFFFNLSASSDFNYGSIGRRIFPFSCAQSNLLMTHVIHDPWKIEFFFLFFLFFFDLHLYSLFKLNFVESIYPSFLFQISKIAVTCSNQLCILHIHVRHIIRWWSAQENLRKSKKNDDDTTFNGMLNNWNVASWHGLQCMQHIRFTWLNSTKCSATTNVIIHRLHGNTVIRIHEYTKRNENCIYLKHMVNGEWWLHLHLQWFWFCFSETSACYCKRLTFASNVYL